MKITKPETTDKTIRIPVARRQKNDKIRTITISSKRGIKALYAVNRKKILTYLFSRAKGWTMAKAQAWIKSHKASKSINNLVNKAMGKNRFKFVLPIIKTRVKIIRDKNGNEKEERYIVGKASSTDKDLAGDRMAPSAIKTMSDSIKQHVINLNAEHDTSWLFELGDITKLDVTKDYELIFESKLNRMSSAKDLWYALTELNKKLGVSIGGYVRDCETSVDKKTGERIRILKAIELDHIAIVSEPANPKTWVSTIQKSLAATGEGEIGNEQGDYKSSDNIKQKLEKLLTDAGKEDLDVKKVLNLIFSEKDMTKKKSPLEAETKKTSAAPENVDKAEKSKKKESKGIKSEEKKSIKTDGKNSDKITKETKKDEKTAAKTGEKVGDYI